MADSTAEELLDRLHDSLLESAGSGQLTGTYKATLLFLTGRVQDAAFKGLAKGEVLFLGLSGAKRGYEDWEITFRFAASPNVAGLQLGNIAGIDKNG